MMSRLLTHPLRGRDHFQEIRAKVQDNVAEFINDYLAVNPKQDKTQP